jgi:hypothetical protein
MQGRPLEEIPPLFLVAWASLFVLVPIWFGAVTWLFRRLRNEHPRTYEALGSPTLFWNNSARNNWLFAKFLCGSQWKSLDDPVLNIACPLMRAFLFVYLVGFVIFSVAIIRLTPPRPRPHAAQDRLHPTATLRSAHSVRFAAAVSCNVVFGD